MTGKERILAAFAHQESDRVPIDFGGHSCSGMHCNAVAGLREYLGLEKRPVKIHEPYQMLGLIEPDLQDAIGCDVNFLYGPKTLFGFANENWREWCTPWGQEVLVPEGFHTASDGNGGLYIYPEGDMHASPSGHMPVGGYFFDAVIRQMPIDYDHLNPLDNCEEFGILTEAELKHYEVMVANFLPSGRAICTAIPGTCLGDIALVPAPFLKNPRGIRDIAEWYMLTASEPAYIQSVFEYQVELALRNFEALFQRVGNTIDVVFLCGTDFGTQTGTFCSPSTFRNLYLPYYQTMTQWIHENTNWKILKHCCGAVYEFMPLFIEAGFDAINPVQCSAVGMDPVRLKQEFGGDLIFWGGGVDTQHVLPFGTSAEVRRQVRERCNIFGRGGGFIFNTIHNVQGNVPIENLAAMFCEVDAPICQ